MPAARDLLCVPCKILHIKKVNLANESFHSASSEQAGATPLHDEFSTDIDGFCLDIDRLERVASARNSNVACQIRRPKNFEKETYFHLRADFKNGTK